MLYPNTIKYVTLVEPQARINNAAVTVSSVDRHGFDYANIEAVVGYGKNQSGVGIGASVLPVGHGQIVLLGIGGLNPAFIQGDPKGFVPVAATRIVYNALNGP